MGGAALPWRQAQGIGVVQPEEEQGCPYSSVPEPRGNYKRAGEGLFIRAYDSSLFDPYESQCNVNFYRKLAIITSQNVGNLRPFWGDLQKDTDPTQKS